MRGEDPVSKNVTVRPETADDRQAVREVNERAFGGVAEARLVDGIRDTAGYIPALSLVAVEANKVIGHILFSEVAIGGYAGPVKFLVLAPIAVLPEYQRRGIGSLLVKRGLEAGKHLGYQAVIVIGHPGFYPRFGFEPARNRLLEVAFKSPVPDEAFLVRELRKGALDGIRGVVEFSSIFYEAM